MKKLMSVYMAVILITSILYIPFYAKDNEITAAEMHSQLCSMISNNEGVSASSPGVNFPTNRLLVKTNSNEKLEENYGAIEQYFELCKNTICYR